ncbi:MAG: ribosomal protein S18-alanine N-acetyltransferase [Marinobacter sp.]|nr:ribosomal protein S18-alanine N-acetyltransferase [Marinobacter sp.]
MTTGDLPKVLELELLGYSHPWTEGVFRDCFKENYRLWSMVQGEVLRGYAVVNYMVDEAHLLNICVHPCLRGQGAGRKLLRHVLSTSVKEGMVQMLLEVRDTNEAATALYVSEGFEEIGRRPGYYPAAAGREDARVMAYRFT